MNNTAENTILSTFPAVTQRALETLNTTRNAWLEARRQQKAAADNIATIRQRRAEMEATTNALNEEWRTLFRESQGVVSKEMKKLRTEIALGRETLEDFDELLAAQESENALLPQEAGKLAGQYISAHNTLVEIRAKQIWEDFMQSHGAMPEQDPVFKLAGVAPDYAALADFRKLPSPAALHKMKIRQEREELQKRNRAAEGI